MHGRHLGLDLTFMRAASHALQIRVLSSSMRSLTGCNNSHCPASKATYPRTCDKKVESEGRVSRRQTGTQNDAVNRQSLISMILQKQQVDVGRDMMNHHRQREFMKILNGMTQRILLPNPHSLSGFSSHPPICSQCIPLQ